MYIADKICKQGPTHRVPVSVYIYCSQCVQKHYYTYSIKIHAKLPVVFILHYSTIAGIFFKK